MPKILTKSGDSLADLYEIEGSIAGIEELDSRELHLVHELGQTVFSERLGGTIRSGATGDLAQNTAFDVLFATAFPGIWRIVNIVVLADVTSRLSHAQVSVQNADSSREVPLFLWDSAQGVEVTARMVVAGAGAADFQVLVGSPLQLPSLGVGPGQRDRMPTLAFRGLTSGFGAGTVELTALIYVAFTHTGGLSSRGLPVPSW